MPPIPPEEPPRGDDRSAAAAADRDAAATTGRAGSGTDSAADVHVIVVNHNGGALLGRCLAALAAQTHRAFRCTVVDNASTDGSAEAAMPADPRFALRRSAVNLGFAAGNNLAALGTPEPLIALLNPDAFPAPGWLGELVAAAARHPGAVMFGSSQRDADDPGRWDGCGDFYFAPGFAWRALRGRPYAPQAADTRVFAPCAAAALYRTAAFAAAGGFDARFFCYLEDVDLAFRLRLAGGAAVQVGRAVVDHCGSAISGRVDGFVTYHSVRNRTWCFVKNMPGPLLAALAAPHLALQLAAGLRSALRGDGAAALRGARDALRGLPAVWAERRRIQAARRVGPAAVAAALTWSPLTYLRRGRDVAAAPAAPAETATGAHPCRS
ncbi:MAG TPA: glycosyltransferase family 2 protein [Alphaproteobacteria bacterium]|nr:glycosyltransferase family 2 protein [Alphaproteobacteria bacterium]